MEDVCMFGRPKRIISGRAGGGGGYTGITHVCFLKSMKTPFIAIQITNLRGILKSIRSVP